MECQHDNKKMLVTSGYTTWCLTCNNQITISSHNRPDKPDEKIMAVLKAAQKEIADGFIAPPYAFTRDEERGIICFYIEQYLKGNPLPPSQEK